MSVRDCECPCHTMDPYPCEECCHGMHVARAEAAAGEMTVLAGRIIRAEAERDAAIARAEKAERELLILKPAMILYRDEAENWAAANKTWEAWHKVAEERDAALVRVKELEEELERANTLLGAPGTYDYSGVAIRRDVDRCRARIAELEGALRLIGDARYCSEPGCIERDKPDTCPGFIARAALAKGERR